MLNKELLDKLIELSPEKKIQISNFEDESSGTDVIDVIDKKTKIILQIHGDSQYLNTSRFILLETEHIILEKILNELYSLKEKFPNIYKKTNLPNILKNINLYQIK